LFDFFLSASGRTEFGKNISCTKSGDFVKPGIAREEKLLVKTPTTAENQQRRKKFNQII